MVVVAWFAWSNYQDNREPATQPRVNTQPGTFGNAPSAVGVYSPPPGGVYYENPAPGDDGSFDCPPGGGPVYVGSSDPANLDGDGDGIGCE